ncbi:MAG: NAD-dependent succinate-semialdehyde dehydrogenase [Verrucomicrobia bacterium]|nr:MAG: NAD-dependent succinate-semialdehyde dehydrogenase [Verrucomicrobiota bacterium]
MKTYPVYLNGNWIVSETSAPVVNPASAEVFANMSTVTAARVAQAIQDAHAAFLDWRQVPGKARGEFLHKVANELNRRREEIARLISLESGKPLSQSLGEIAMSVDHLRWFAEEARRIYGRVIPPHIASRRHWTVRQPVGVVAAMTPWNFPLMLAVRKVAAAIAAGCTVVHKPSLRTPFSAVAFGECLAESQPIKGLFQIVAGEAEMIAGEFLAHPLCRRLSFTGSTATGRKLAERAASHLKPLLLELSGNAPALVFDDCDLSVAVNAVLLSKFRNSGQSCIAVNRIYVQRTIYPGFVQMLTEKVKGLKLASGLEPDAQVGPLIDPPALERALEHIADAVNGGGKLLCGGKRARMPGYFLEPTVISEVPRTSLCMFEETFAPLAAITPFDTEREGVELANDSVYGLAAYVFTQNLSRAMRLADSLSAGIVGINDGVPTNSQSPFGGIKQSGWGRELGAEGIEAFLETKLVSLGLE